MKKGLNKTEVTGLMLLVVLIVVITGSGILLKNCRRSSDPKPSEGLQVEIIDSVKEAAPSPEEKFTDRKNKESKKEAKKKNSSRSRKKAARTKAVKERKNPFTDTIPRN